MTTHVFLGAGPANLDRALKIRNRDKNAKFIFIDKRVTSDGQLDRDKSRANIFRFPLSDKNNIISNGIDEEAFNDVSTERDFSEKDGFQFGDTQVFGTERFTQIQIRDLQQLYLDSLKGPNTTFIPENIDINEFYKVGERTNINDIIFSSLQRELSELSEQREALRQNTQPTNTHEVNAQIQKINARYDQVLENLQSLSDNIISEDNTDLMFHNAVGALQQDREDTEGKKISGTTPDSIIYPAKSELGLQSGVVSVDLSAMPVTAMHGTATFSLTNSGINPENFASKTKSLDDSKWQEVLKDLGWNLLRPPRVRLFYANDTLYIGTEVPTSFAKHVENGRPNAEYQRKQTAFTRAIAKLMLPDYAQQIERLPANDSGVNAPSFFLTNRGETGDVIDIAEGGAVVINHGDRRYLPHYQTGSGFLTATQQNDAYVNIFLPKNFKEVFDWAKQEGHVEKEYDQTFKDYAKAIGADVNDENYAVKLTVKQKKEMLKLFQTDLYTFATHEILAHNKEKVDKYFTQIQKQALNLLAKEDNFSVLIAQFKSTQSEDIPQHMHVVQYFNPVDSINENLKPLVIMEMLIHGTDKFLLEVLPTLIDVDLSAIDLENPEDVSRLHNLRDSFTDDYIKYINSAKIIDSLNPQQRQQLFTVIKENRSNLESAIEDITNIIGICPNGTGNLQEFANKLLETSNRKPERVQLLKASSFDTHLEAIAKKAHNLELYGHKEAAGEARTICNSLINHREDFSNGKIDYKQFVQKCEDSVKPENNKALYKSRGVLGAIQRIVTAISDAITGKASLKEAGMTSMERISNIKNSLMEIKNESPAEAKEQADGAKIK